MSPVCTMGVPGPPAPRTGAGTGAGRHGTLTRERKRCPQPTPPRGGLMGKRKPAKHRKATGADRSATPRESPHRRPVFPEVRLQRRCPPPLTLGLLQPGSRPLHSGQLLSRDSPATERPYLQCPPFPITPSPSSSGCPWGPHSPARVRLLLLLPWPPSLPRRPSQPMATLHQRISFTSCFGSP